MENGPLEDVFPIEMGIFHCYVSLPEGTPFVSRWNNPLILAIDPNFRPGTSK